TVRFFTGAFGGVLTSIVMSIVSDAFEYSRRGSALGIVMSAFAVASVFGIPLGLYLANLSGWQTPFFILGLLCIPIFFLVLVFVPRQDAHLKTQQSKDPFKIFKMIAADRNQQLSLSLIFFLVLGQFSVIPFISPSFVMNAGLLESQLPL